MSAGFKLKKIYKTGYCVGRGKLASRSYSWKKVRFYTQCFLLESPKKELFLIDTGYGQSLKDATSKGIYALYCKLLPFTVEKEEGIVAQLAQDGITPKDLSHVIITHFHPDHIGALPEFSQVPWIYRKKSLEELQALSPLQGLKKGFIRTLVPSVPRGSIAINEEEFDLKWHDFSAMDLFKEGSLYLVDLPGHAKGQMGIAIKGTFLVADAMWSKEALPHRWGLLLQEDPQAYLTTYQLIKKVSPFLEILPTHVMEKING